MPYATMGEAHAEWHRNSGSPMGTPGCPMDACHLPDPEPLFTVQTPYGEDYFYTYTEAKMAALSAAKITGKACKVIRYDLYQED